MFENIMVPMDGSPCSYMALEKAIALQKLCGPTTKIRIVYVYRHQGQMESSVSMVRPTAPESIDKALSSYAREVVQAAKDRAIELGSVNVGAHVLSGPTARTIIKFAEDRRIDLIIIGGRGHGDLEALLLGSVSHKVTSMAHCPVMVVR
ncbi:Nucleotide-binding universal stress protein, UspA family [Cohaesibacter sp. ES.047]|uniref:universal stress protein n=1 Tax=Cohaesibacter sp. ES.047 TaxID=1798205 RepID=UPI000BB6B570|nr:universal stress protein [Cohaesibacter sp. ES.047]SNY92990.1 Nucleotide-binding universal stress protein, UspA family [Cohaesibacter sp. ES.047]